MFNWQGGGKIISVIPGNMQGYTYQHRQGVCRYLACMSVHLVFTFLLAKVMSSFLPTIKMQLEKHLLWR